MRFLQVFLLIWLVSGCSQKNKKSPNIEEDPSVHLDSLFMVPKYGITHGDTPIWYYNESENLIIEEIAETLQGDQVFLNDLSIADYPKTSGNLPESFVLIRLDERIKISNYLNLEDSARVQFSRGKLVLLEIKNHSNTVFRMEGMSVFEVTLDDYKVRYPGSYSVRSLFSSHLFRDYNKLDSVETIDLTFLWMKNARIDIIWLNKYAVHGEIRFFD